MKGELPSASAGSPESHSLLFSCWVSPSDPLLFMPIVGFLESAWGKCKAIHAVSQTLWASGLKD